MIGGELLMILEFNIIGRMDLLIMIRPRVSLLSIATGQLWLLKFKLIKIKTQFPGPTRHIG